MVFCETWYVHGLHLVVVYISLCEADGLMLGAMEDLQPLIRGVVVVFGDNALIVVGHCAVVQVNEGFKLYRCVFSCNVKSK